MIACLWTITVARFGSIKPVRLAKYIPAELLITAGFFLRLLSFAAQRVAYAANVASAFAF